MKKLMMLIALAAAVAVQAETRTGKVYAETPKSVSYWKIGKETKDGKMACKANIHKDDSEKIAVFAGKTVEVTGELDPASKFPSFLAGVQIKEIEINPVQ